MQRIVADVRTGRVETVDLTAEEIAAARRQYEHWLANRPRRRRITPREARARIASYWPAILAASKTDAEVMDWVFQSLAGPIELDNPLTTQGLDAMVAKGLLDAAGRAAFLVDGDGDYPG